MPYAQTFTAGLTGALDTVQLNIHRVGSPGDLTVAIQGASSLANPGAPDDQDVLATQTVPAADVGTLGPNVQTVVFDTPATVQAGTTYALVVRTANPADGSNQYLWYGTESHGYSGGVRCYRPSADWDCSLEGDFIFATYVTTGPPGPPEVGLSASSLTFGTVPTGSTSPAQTLTVTNAASGGSQVLEIGQLSTGGVDPGDFALSNDTCSNTSLAAGSSCTVDVSFAPAGVGSRTATLDVPSNAATSPDQVALSGNGTALADVRLNLSGPASAKKSTQVTYLITVSNVGPSAAHNVVMSSPVPSGAVFVGVSTSQGSCTKPSPGASKGTITCWLGDLAAGGSSGSSVNIKVNAKAGSSLTEIASAYSTADGSGPATPDPDTSNNWASLTTSVTK